MSASGTPFSSATPSNQPVRPNSGALLICLLLATSIAAAYYPIHRNQFINLDDQDYITENSQVQAGLSWHNVAWAFKTDHAANWHPITWLSHMLDCQLYGLNPVGHHLTSVILHAATTVLLFLLLRRMTGATGRSATVAALFGLHPLHVESVAWAAERKDVLSALFLMLTLWYYARYVETSPARKGAPQTACKPSRLFYLLAMTCFVLGLMSKPMLVTLPFVLLLLDLWPLKRITSFSPAAWRPLLSEKIPFFALAVISCWVTFSVQQGGGATSAGEKVAMSSRAANAVTSYLNYLGKTFWPLNLAVYYPHPALHFPESTQWPVYWLLLGVVVLCSLSVVALLRVRKEPYLAVGWFWYLGTLVPVIGLVQVGKQAMADRYTYIPLLGILIALTWLISEALEKNRLSKWLLWATSSTGVLACIFLTHLQVGYWQNNFTVFQHAVKVAPYNPVAHFSLALAWAEKRQYDQAVAELRETLQEQPSYANAYSSLGDCLTMLERPAEAIEAYEMVLRLNPNHSLAHYNLATILGSMGKIDEAVMHYRESVRLNPNFPEGQYQLGAALFERKEFAEAETRFAAAVSEKPDYPEALTGLGRLLTMRGQFIEAQARFREAARLSPTNAAAQINLAGVLMRIGQTNEATLCFSNALRLEPDLAEKNVRAAKAQASRGQLDAAISQLLFVVRLQPTNAEAHENLGFFYSRHGKPQEAAKHFEQALRLIPDAPGALNGLAWMLATSPIPDVRNGARAAELAQKALTLSQRTNVVFMATLDAALAESGKFDKALEAAAQTKAGAQASGQTDLVTAAEQRIALYQAGKPFHEQ
jgi:tetratricopeptide (TPR) repeat protein